ncbi:MAG TPA: hypothetical protein VFS92_09535, partial [Planctomycetota bacterium]|nr:hypothetical protein [Planctomycetota bacterium]
MPASRAPRRREDPSDVEVRLLLDTLLALTAEDDLLSAIRRVLRLTCVAAGFEAGQAWFPDGAGTGLECAPVWYGGSTAPREFREACVRTRVPRGRELAGRACRVPRCCRCSSWAERRLRPRSAQRSGAR